MPAIKAVILFDQFLIPVSMTKAIVDTDIQLHEYHNEDRSRTCRKAFCSGCGAELTADDIVKGYAYDDDCLVLLKKEDLKQAKIDTDNCIDIHYSTELDQISPIYFNTSYFASPESGYEKILEIVRSMLLEQQKILIGRAVLGGFDSPAAIIPIEDGLVISKLYFEDEINKTRKSYKKPTVLQSELQSIKRVLSDMSCAFDLSVYENEYQKNLRSLIASKIADHIDTYNIG